MAKKGLAKFKRKNPDEGLFSFVPKDIKSGIISFVAPAAGGYVVTRIANRAARTYVPLKFPRLGRHAGPLASLVALGGAYLACKKIKQLTDHETAILAGVIIAVVQSIIQSYMPGLLWMFDMNQPSLPAPKQAQQLEAYEEDFADDEDVEDEVPQSGTEPGFEEGIEDEVEGPLGDGMFN